MSGVGEARESDHDSALLVTALAVSIGCERAVIINRYSETMFQGKCDQAKRSHRRLRMTPFACGDQKGELQRTSAGASYTKFPRLAFLKCPTKKPKKHFCPARESRRSTSDALMLSSRFQPRQPVRKELRLASSTCRRCSVVALWCLDLCSQRQGMQSGLI